MFRWFTPWALVWRWAHRRIEARNSVTWMTDDKGNAYVGVDAGNGFLIVRQWDALWKSPR